MVRLHIRSVMTYLATTSRSPPALAESRPTEPAPEYLQDHQRRLVHALDRAVPAQPGRMVPLPARQVEPSDRAVAPRKEYAFVVKRLESFFVPANYTNVRGLFVLGY